MMRKNQFKSVHVKLGICLGFFALSMTGHAYANPGDSSYEDINYYGEIGMGDESADITHSIYLNDSFHESEKGENGENTGSLSLAKTTLEEKSKRVKEINALIDEAIKSLSRQLKKNTADVDSLRTGITKAQSKYLRENNASIESLRQKLEQNKSDLSSVNQKLEQNKNDLNSVKAKLEEEQNKRTLGMNAINETTEAMRQQLEQNKSDLSSVNQKLEQNKNDLNSVKAKLEEEQNKRTLGMNAINETTEAMRQQLEQNRNDLNSVKAKLEEEQNKRTLGMNTINETTEAMRQQLEQNRNDLNSVKAKLEEEQNKRKKELREQLYRMPFFRLSPNQVGAVSSGRLDGFTINSNVSIVFSIYKTISSDVLWENRDPEEKEILKAMGRSGQRYFAPSPFYVVKMTWDNANSDSSAGDSRYWAFYHFINYHNWVTHASYAKLIRGNIEGSYFRGITDKWRLCGIEESLRNRNSYTHPHPYLKSTSGEVLFTMLATVAGDFPLDPENPKWGFLPYNKGLEYS